MQLFISVLRPLEEACEARDLIVVVPEDAVVGDLAAALDRALPATAPGQSLRLVVSAGEPVSAPPSSLWHGSRCLDPRESIGSGSIRNGMLLGLGAAVLDDVEPVGVVELRVVGGQGAGAVHRLSLGSYTLGGPEQDITLEGEAGREKIADLTVSRGGQVLLSPVPEVAAAAAAPSPPAGAAGPGREGG